MSATATTMERKTWTCPNCSGQTRATRKRCSECGTSRH
jgi:ribosomal protein S27AE